MRRTFCMPVHVAGHSSQQSARPKISNCLIALALKLIHNNNNLLGSSPCALLLPPLLDKRQPLFMAEVWFSSASVSLRSASLYLNITRANRWLCIAHARRKKNVCLFPSRAVWHDEITRLCAARSLQNRRTRWFLSEPESQTRF